MKKIIIAISFIILNAAAYCQQWTAAQLTAANTAKDVQGITETEKSIITYINLARIYPGLFAKNELENYTGPAAGNKKSKYKKSLAKELNSRSPVSALQYGAQMQELAVCFAKESGDAGYVGHNRSNCPDGYLGENCSYGMQTALDIVMQWLIDDGIPGTGHRVNCLDKNYSEIGVSLHTHKKYRYCTVADFH